MESTRRYHAVLALIDEMKHLTPSIMKQFTRSSRSASVMEGYEIAALWSNDDRYTKDLYMRAVRAAQAGDRQTAVRLSLEFDGQVLRYHNDKRSGSNPRMQPLVTGFAQNKVLTDGITRFNEIISDKSVEFFYYIASGTGITSPSVGQHRLAAENARVDMRQNGVFDAAGNMQINRSMFPTGIASATITEFGGCDAPAEPSTFAWRVVMDESEYFDHEQGVTFYTAGHYLVTYSK